MSIWTDAAELSGRKAFDIWRFTEAGESVPWDWADMAPGEKQWWIDRAATPPGGIAAVLDQHGADCTDRGRQLGALGTVAS